MRKLLSITLMILVILSSSIAFAEDTADSKERGPNNGLGPKESKDFIDRVKPDKPYISDEIIVRFKGDAEPFRVIKIPEGKVGEKIKEYLARADVVYAEPNYIVHTTLFPNDPSFSKLYGLHNTGQTEGTSDADIDAPEAWNVQNGSKEVIIAVIDTGVNYNHPDLAANMWTNSKEIAGNGIDDDGNGFIDDVRGWDFYNNDNNPFDDNGHGTHVAGTIGAVGNNGVGVVGVNWNVKIMPLKFLSSGGSGTTTDAVEAINYATKMKAHIMSNSWGGGGYSQTLKDAIANANAAGILFVAAAGNDGTNNDASPFYPASYDVANVVTVAATDHNDQKASFSNYGAVSVDLGAPGVNIYSTVPTGSCSLCDPSGYRSLSGTSMATPHVSGVAGLIKAQFPTLTSNGIKARLLAGVDDVPSLSGITITGGRLNANNSLEQDSTPPSSITDLAFADSTFNSITLTWTATGDDGFIGTADLYDLRYSTSPISDTNWDSATQVIGEPKPKSAGSSETFTVTGLAGNTLYYFALKAIDNVNNSSGLSNVPSATTKTPAIVFQDNMESGTNGWTHGGAGDNWQLGKPTSGPGFAYSGSNVWATNIGGNYGTNYMNAWLVSPGIDLSGIKSSQLEFQHYYYTETNYDGGIVEVSNNGGDSWTQITPVGGYPLILKSGFGNPLGPVPAYSGYSGAGWHKAAFDISNYDGSSNVKIRFRFGTDSSVNSYPGWYIDDVTLYGELAEPNNSPIAGNQSVTTNEDTPLAITLTATDADGDPLTYSIVSGPSSGALTGAAPNVTYIPKANYYGSDSFTFKANDGKADSNVATVSITVNSVNDAPIANVGPDKTGYVSEMITFDGSGSSDLDGTIVSYNWDFGDGTNANGAVVTHTYATSGGYTATLKVTDNGGATASDTALVTIIEKSVEVIEFSDSFENGLNKWIQDSQADWFVSTQRATDGKYSAEVDGLAINATLTMKNPINLIGKKNATLTFSWLIESGLDKGEYLCLDLYNGTSWREYKCLKGDVDKENIWYYETIDLSAYLASNFNLRFRAKMSGSTEDANVDNVKVVSS